MKKGTVSILSSLAGAGLSAIVVSKVMRGQVNNTQKISDKHLDLFLLMNQWVKVKQEGKGLAEYFEKNNYKNVAIYGMSYVGETLYDELKGSEVCVKYGIDKNADRIYAEVDVVTLEDKLPEVDAVIVTAITFFDEIAEVLEQKLDCPILSLEDILYEV